MYFTIEEITMTEPVKLKLVKEYGDPDNDNMLIKGDNLLVMNCLLGQFKNQVKFEMEKETKNTIRYAEVLGDDGMPPAIKTLYLQKWIFGKENPPAKVKVVISAGK